MSLKNININDPLDKLGINNNFINNEKLSNNYIEYATKWSNFPMYKDKLHELFNLINEKQVILLTSGTGSGKTVLVPKYILKYMISNNIPGITCITNPKTITTLYNAEYGANTLDVKLGEEVGYRYKNSLKDYVSNKTKLLYTTDGLLLAILLNEDNLLRKYNCVIIDEAHERNIQIDLLLYYLKQIVLKRKDFKLIIMSATINSNIFKDYYNDININFGEIHYTGKNYPIEQKWLNKDILKKDYINYGVNLIKNIISSTKEGDILMFVSTEKETYQCCNLLNNYNNTFCAEVFAKMKSDNKEIAIDKNKYKIDGYKRKVLFATNVAESSITVDGLKFVIDSGYEIVNNYDSKNNMIILNKEFTTQAQIKQRIGRVGRTSEGIAYHLYTKETYDNLKDYPEPNILKSDITLNLLSIFKNCKSLKNMVNICNNLVTKPLFSQILQTIHKLFYYNIIKIIKYSLDSIDEKYYYTKLEFNKINYKSLKDYNDIINYNGTLKTIGYIINKLNISSIELGLCLVYSYYLKCQNEMIIIICLLEVCNYKIDDLFNKKINSKKLNNQFNKSIIDYSDHLTLYNIYCNNYMNENYKYLNIKLWNKCESNIEKLKKIVNNISSDKYNLINKDNKLFKPKIFKNINDRLLYTLYNGMKYNLIKKVNNKYISINYLNNNEGTVEKLFFINDTNKYKYGISHYYTQLFNKDIWKIVSLIPNNIIK